MGKVGVVIGRFQVDDLSNGHLDIFKRAMSENGKLLVILGNSHLINTIPDPLDYPVRCKMVQGKFPEACITFVRNRKDDADWSKDIDKIIHELYPTDTPTLYGGRDSFIPNYSGKNRCIEVHSYNTISGSKIRETVGDEVLDEVGFRKGIIYTTRNRFPRLHGTVDIVCVDTANQTIGLGKKPLEHEYRFAGGFVDIKDRSFEMAAKREFGEEFPGLEVGNWQFICSCRVDDWRFGGVEESEYIMTSFFYCEKLWGATHGGDDISEVRWFKIDDLRSNRVPLIDCHEILGQKFLEWYDSKNTQSEANVGELVDVT